jgi:hypothetical protein
MREAPTGTPSVQRSTRVLLRWATGGLILWIAAPIALVGTLTVASAGLRVVETDQPSWVQASSVGTSVSRQVRLSVEWSKPVSAVAPAWSGLVRSVMVSPNSTVNSGDAVARIDGTTRLAWHSPEPFYRALRLGDSGDDVAALQALLQSRGLPSDTSGKFGAATSRGVSALAKDLGAPSNGAIFQPEWLVYLPTPSLEVQEVALSVGTLAPSAGVPVFVGEPVILSARLVSDPSLEASGERHAVVALPDETLRVGKQVIELSEDRTSVSPDGLLVMSALLRADDEMVVGTLDRTLIADAVEVPAAAVHTDSIGSTCVRVRRDEVQSTIAVEVIAGSGGRAAVVGDLQPGDYVGVAIIGVTAVCVS